MVPRGRIELPTLRSSGERSTNELPRHNCTEHCRSSAADGYLDVSLYAGQQERIIHHHPSLFQRQRARFGVPNGNRTHVDAD